MRSLDPLPQPEIKREIKIMPKGMITKGDWEKRTFKGSFKRVKT